MKKLYFTLLPAIFIVSAALAQKTSGVIYYTQEIDTKAANIQISGGPDLHMPDKIINKFELSFNPTGAKFQRSVAEDAPGMVMRIGGSELYFANDKVTEAIELNGESFLIENALGFASANVEKTDEVKTIAGFNCKKAIITGKNDSKTVIWYTTDLNFKASPMAPFWTEGVVLGIENNRMKFYATSLENMKIKDTDIALPKKATLITQAEYDKKMEEFRAKMGSGPGGNMIIRRN